MPLSLSYSTRALWLRSVFLALLFVVTLPLRVEAEKVSDFVNHGPPDRAARARGVIAATDSDGKNLIVALISSASGTSVLLIDAETGETEQFTPNPPILPGTKDFLLTKAGHLYAYGDSHLLVFDIHERRWITVEKGYPRFGYSLAEADDGSVYIAVQPTAGLMRFDPTQGKLTKLGRLAQRELVSLYPQFLAVDKEGWVYAGLTGKRIVAFHPESKEKRHFPTVAEETEAATGYVYRGEDGYVYGRTATGGPWYQFLAGEAKALESEPEVKEKPRTSGRHNAVLSVFPSGGEIREISIPDRYAVLSIPNKDGEPREKRINFNYDAAGPLMTAISAGSDGMIYGSTGHPRILFGFNPTTRTYFRKQFMEGGHFNAMTAQGEKLYGALYADGQLHEIETNKPWDTEGHNPRVAAEARNERGMITRPYAVLGHSNGRHVIMGGYYDRTGYPGGGLVIYDQESRQARLLSSPELLNGHSAKSLSSLPGNELLVGTTVGMRGRAISKLRDAAIYRLNLETAAVQGEPLYFSLTESILDLITLNDGEAVAGITSNAEFFLYDIGTKQLRFKKSLSEFGEPAGSQGARIMAVSPQGKVLILFKESIVEFDLGTKEGLRIGSPPVEITTGIILKGNRLYFISRSDLWSCSLKSDK